MAMRNKIRQLIDELGVSAYRFAEDTGISRNTVYLLRNNPNQFPSGEVFDRIIEAYGVKLDRIVEYYKGEDTVLEETSRTLGVRDEASNG